MNAMELFLVPVESLRVDPRLILRNEPLSRGGESKSHMCEYVYRSGREVVWVCRWYPQGLTEIGYRSVLRAFSKAKNWGWTQVTREPTVYVRGRVWHPDHKTIVLDDWHRVSINSEREAPGVRNVVFLDQV